MEQTIAYYEKWLGQESCLATDGLKFIYSEERNKVQAGYADPFDLYIWVDDQRIIVSYGKRIDDKISVLKERLLPKQTLLEIMAIIEELFVLPVNHNIKYGFSGTLADNHQNNAKNLTHNDYADYEMFFKTMHPNAKDVSWLQEYFDEMVAEKLCVGLYEDGKVVCCTDAPMIPYLVDAVQEIGVNTLSDYQQKGYAFSVCQQAVKNILENKKEPQWSTVVNNIGSQKLAERIGFKKLADVLTVTLSGVNES